MNDPLEFEIAPDVLQAVEDQLTDEVVTRLIAHAQHKRQRLWWQGIRNGEMPEGIEPSDIIARAVEKTLTGKRRWDPSKNPDLYAYLTSVVDSDINHAAESWANQYLRTASSLRPDGDDDQGGSYLDGLSARTPNPEQLALAAEGEKASEEFLLGLLENLEDDPLLYRMVELITFDDINKPADLAARLEKKTKDINNARKRLRRRVEKYRVTRQMPESGQTREETPR